ncbi:MAG: type II toxin-antitoxin system RelE/ParE family toxin [Pseudomonadota bacterium]|jgi:hypothetical protein
MLIYKTRWFDRWARKERLTAPGLCKAVEELANGLFDADLGSGLFKKRVGRSRQGKRGGFRVLVATNKSGSFIFIYGFSKNQRANIEIHEADALKKLATHLLSMRAEAWRRAVDAGELIEVNCYGEEELSDTVGCS